MAWITYPIVSDASAMPWLDQSSERDIDKTPKSGKLKKQTVVLSDQSQSKSAFA
jgi:hypothetical protein